MTCSDNKDVWTEVSDYHVVWGLLINGDQQRLTKNGEQMIVMTWSTITDNQVIWHTLINSDSHLMVNYEQVIWSWSVVEGKHNSGW